MASPTKAREKRKANPEPEAGRPEFVLGDIIVCV